MNEILLQLNRILKEITKNDNISISFSSNFEELNLDSIENIKFFIKVEEYFGFEFEDEMLLPEKYSSMLDMCTYILETTKLNL